MATIISTHLYEVAKRHAHEIVGREEVQRMLDNLKDSNPKAVEYFTPDVLPFKSVVAVIKNLLKDQVSVRNLEAFLKALVEKAVVTKDIDKLTEHVRKILV